MQTITVGEFGISYLSKCLFAYFEGCGYLLLFLIIMSFIVLKGSKRDIDIFLPPVIALFVTIFNPVVPVVMNHIFDVNKEYYRFFWIAPIVIVIAFGCVRVMEIARGKIKVIAFILLLSALVITGKFVYKDGYIKSPNIYKMPTEIPILSEMIHKDSISEYPRAIFEYDFEMCIRQYDPKMMLTIGRDEYIYAMSGNLKLEDILAEENYYNRVLAVVVLGIPIEEEEFIRGLEETNTRYVVLTKGSMMCDYVEHAGLRLVGDTTNHVVYCLDSDNITDWELPDYSDVWENY